MSRGRVRALPVLAVLVACAPAIAAPQPEVLAVLEGRHATAPNGGTAFALGTAYFRAGRWDDAVRTLEAAVRADPASVEALMYLAFALDSAGRDEPALARYDELLERAASGLVRAVAFGRRTRAGRRIRDDQLRRALADGRWPRTSDPEEQEVQTGIVPFVVRPTDSASVGLGIGFARYLADVFVRADGRAIDVHRSADLWRALGRDAAPIVRIGRILGLRYVVHGRIEPGADDEHRSISAALVDAVSGEVIAEGSVDTLASTVTGAAGPIAAALLTGLAREVPDELLAARRVPVTEALVAYGQAREALAAGDDHAAVDLFQRAVLLHPGWREAREARDHLRRFLSAPDRHPARLAGRVDGPTSRALVRARRDAALAVAVPEASGAADVLDPVFGMVRHGAAEVTGTVGPERAVRHVVTVVIAIGLRFPW